MINLFKKIYWRFLIIIKSIIPISLAIIFEYDKHPWEYIINYIFYSANKRYIKSHYFLNKYFKIIEINKKSILIDFNKIKILLDKNFYENPKNLVGILTQYFDLIYPLIVRFPIPIIISEGPYEIKGCNLNQGDIVIDAGANLGFFTFLASNKINNGTVYSFEPIDEAIDILNQSKLYNKNNSNINVLKIALGKGNENLIFSVDLENLGASTRNKKGDRIIKQETIDNLVINHQLNKVDFIKMDIEGMEVEAIEGAKITIKKFKPKLALCIYHNKDDLKNLKKIIKSIRKDYKFYNTKFKLYAW